MDEEAYRYLASGALSNPGAEVPLVVYADERNRIELGKAVVTETDQGLKVAVTITNREAADMFGLRYDLGPVSIAESD